MIELSRQIRRLRLLRRRQKGEDEYQDELHHNGKTIPQRERLR
jgi:hypothetical protein